MSTKNKNGLKKPQQKDLAHELSSKLLVDTLNDVEKAFKYGHLKSSTIIAISIIARYASEKIQEKK